MTTAPARGADSARKAESASKTEFDLAADQLRAVERFTADYHEKLLQEQLTTSTRETRMDAARRLDVLQRQQAALEQRAHEQLQRAGGPQFVPAPLRAIVAHRSPWFVERVTAALTGGAIEVLATPVNGADAVGIVVAEQPDLLLVEDSLEMLPGEDVVRAVRAYCPDTTIAAQVAYGDRLPAFLEAGATTVFTRHVPPADVAAQLCELVGQRAPAPAPQRSRATPGTSSRFASAS